MADTSPVVSRRADQRQPQAGEPVCVICGRYGAYVCDATDEDVCSLECRDDCMSRHQKQVGEQKKREGQLRKRLGICISADGVAGEEQSWPAPLVEFDQEQGNCQLPRELLANLKANHFKRPTPVQMQTIPCVLQGRNVLVSAPTGTGKTAAYLIPAITQVLTAREQEKEVLALVLAPIRELAIQIESVAKLLMRGITDMKTALLVGGFSVPTQRYRLQGGVQLIVATPGRFLDIFTNYSDGDAILSIICTCVIDEIDVMLDVGFRPQILQIVSLLASLTDKCRDGVQLLFLSATVSDEVEGMVRQTLTSQHCQNIVRIQVKSNATKASASGASRYALNPRIQQQIRWAENKAKKNELFSFLSGKEEESTLVFVASKVGATMLAEAIGKRCGISAAAIHADKTQHERLKLLEAFINLEIHVLVSTNVLSRGMDLLHVQNVVVYDFPHKVADYVHLIGRTGRSDDISGTALTLMNPKDSPAFRELIPLLRQAKVSVPQEMYQRLHSEYGKQHARSAAIVMDESRRAFRIRTQLSDDIGAQVSEWKQWNYHGTKRRRFG